MQGIVNVVLCTVRIELMKKIATMTDLPTWLMEPLRVFIWRYLKVRNALSLISFSSYQAAICSTCRGFFEITVFGNLIFNTHQVRLTI